MYDNEYQTNREPTSKEVWYSRVIDSTHQKTTNNSTLNRYKTKLRLTTSNGLSVIEFMKKSQVHIKESNKDQIYYVDASKQYRPDLISLEVYGTASLYWVILSCNNLKNPLELKAGTNIRIPIKNSIIHDRRLV